jgi:hypothetical protein
LPQQILPTPQQNSLAGSDTLQITSPTGQRHAVIPNTVSQTMPPWQAGLLPHMQEPFTQLSPVPQA